MLTKILTGAPWWAYLLLIYMLIVGLKARRPFEIPLRRLLLLSLGFTAWGISGLFSRDGLEPLHLAIWCGSLLLGGALGWQMISSLPLEVNRDKASIRFPGGYSLLSLFLTIFAVKYCLGIAGGMHPEWRTAAPFVSIDIGISGTITGIFLGRLLCTWRRYQGKSIDLSKVSDVDDAEKIAAAKKSV